MITKFSEYNKLNEDDSTVGSVGSGTAVGGGDVGSFTTAAGTSYSGGDSGSAFSTNSSSSGMGPIISAQPSSTPGDLNGSTIGSGDIGQPLGVYTKSPTRINKKKKSKRSKTASKIDDLYLTKYKDGKIITKFSDFK